jgi:hypothetical protein
MKFSVFGVVTLSLLLAAAIGCERSATAPEPGPVADQTGDKELLTPAHLQWLWDLSEVTTYHVFSTPVSRTLGGTLLAYPGSSQNGLQCRVEIPPNAIPRAWDFDNDGFVTISIHVPVVSVQPVEPWVPVYKLEPDGIQFQHPVTVTLVYPEVLPQVDRLRVFCLVNNANGMGFSDLHASDYSALGVWSMTFTTMHFTRWPLEDGKGTPPPPLL